VFKNLSTLTKSMTVCAAAAMGIAGCASTPVPNEKLAVAQAEVQRAEQSGAPALAPVEMNAARDKLVRAQQAVAKRDAVSAEQLSEQADVDAKLAEATAQQQRSRKAAIEFDASMQALRNESMRNSQSTQ